MCETGRKPEQRKWKVMSADEGGSPTALAAAAPLATVGCSRGYKNTQKPARQSLKRDRVNSLELFESTPNASVISRDANHSE